MKIVGARFAFARPQVLSISNSYQTANGCPYSGCRTANSRPAGIRFSYQHPCGMPECEKSRGVHCASAECHLRPTAAGRPMAAFPEHANRMHNSVHKYTTFSIGLNYYLFLVRSILTCLAEVIQYTVPGKNFYTKYSDTKVRRHTL